MLKRRTFSQMILDSSYVCILKCVQVKLSKYIVVCKIRVQVGAKKRKNQYEGLDGGSWYSLIIKNIAIYSLSLKFWLIH